MQTACGANQEPAKTTETTKPTGTTKPYATNNPVTQDEAAVTQDEAAVTPGESLAQDNTMLYITVAVVLLLFIIAAGLIYFIF